MQKPHTNATTQHTTLPIEYTVAELPPLHLSRSDFLSEKHLLSKNNIEQEQDRHIKPAPASKVFFIPRRKKIVLS